MHAIFNVEQLELNKQLRDYLTGIVGKLDKIRESAADAVGGDDTEMQLEAAGADDTEMQSASKLWRFFKEREAVIDEFNSSVENLTDQLDQTIEITSANSRNLVFGGLSTLVHVPTRLRIAGDLLEAMHQYGHIGGLKMKTQWKVTLPNASACNEACSRHGSFTNPSSHHHYHLHYHHRC